MTEDDRIAKMQQRMLKMLLEEMQGWMADLLKDALTPAKIMEFIRGMGIDMSQFSQLFGRMAQAGTMPQGFDPYQVLGLDKSAPDEEVTRRYREMMRKIHPDVAGQEMNFLAAIVNAAYNMIWRERGR